MRVHAERVGYSIFGPDTRLCQVTLSIFKEGFCSSVLRL